MESIQLIADSGIQFHKFDIKIDPNADVIRSIGFYEWLDTREGRANLEYAKYLADLEVWVSMRQLGEEGFLDEHGQLIDTHLNLNILTKLDEDSEVFPINNIEDALTHFENKWIPLPYFEGAGSDRMQFGPINWCRIKLVPIGDSHRREKRYRTVLAFDTAIAKDLADMESPLLFEDAKCYTLCSNLDLILNYTQEKHGCGWVSEYIADIIHGGSQNIPNDFPSLKYIAFYIYFVKYLSEMKVGNEKVLPSVMLYPNNGTQSVDVELILDIGNSNTCGVLFESPNGTDSFKFTEVKKLLIQDMSQPEYGYDDPFSMRLAFHKVDFGEMGYQSKKFQWPSFTRVGTEAKRLIYQSTNRISADGYDLTTNHSSPKRYLWDDDESDVQWEPIQLNGRVRGNSSLYIEGISEQFTKEGKFTKLVDFGTSNNFSKKSLMTFVFIEILAHALVQINSIDFRTKHGSATIPRRLRRVVVTCPTAMTQAEQVVLRQCADEAAISLGRFFKGTYKDEYDEDRDRNRVEIIPSVKDIRKNLPLIDTKKDWMYDEATCCQMVFLYAEISKRYLNNCQKYFDLYGKYRKDLAGYDKKSLTIGSVDIGGGTTDLMICTYKYGDSSSASVLTPIPLYWESFYTAGDDLLKEIVRQVIIEGRVNDEAYRGCTGVIENAARERKVSGVERKLNTFFGEDVNAIDFFGRQLRRKFNTQISVPIAERYLEHVKEENGDTFLTFDEMFPQYKPNKELLEAFDAHFGFRIEDIRWKLSANRINDIISMVFEPMIRQISALLHVMGCDFVLLAGRPTALSKIGDLFLKFYPVSPDRIISLNDYRVGRWYPFQDGNGYFTDQKSLVAVGAAVALMGGKLDKLPGFRLNMDILKRNLISTAEYFGTYDRNTNNITRIFISPDENSCLLEVETMPMTIGFKRLKAEAYPSRVIYHFDFDDAKILAKQSERHGDVAEDILAREVENYKTNLKNRTPFRVRFTREYRENREVLKIESIEDRHRETLSKSIFKLKLKTLDEEKAYWLDTGEFVLKIKPK